MRKIIGKAAAKLGLVAFTTVSALIAGVAYEYGRGLGTRLGSPESSVSPERFMTGVGFPLASLFQHLGQKVPSEKRRQYEGR